MFRIDNYVTNPGISSGQATYSHVDYDAAVAFAMGLLMVGAPLEVIRRVVTVRVEGAIDEREPLWIGANEAAMIERKRRDLAGEQ